MRYIVTKDGRIAEIKETMFVKQCEDGKRLVYKDSPFICVLYGNDTILKQADTIEELCDELVAEDRTGHRWLAYITTKTYEDSEGNIIEYKVYGNKYTEEYPHNLIDDIKRKGLKIYGAIWVTDENGVPTLKPVSKVNEEGALELICLKN